MNQYITPQNLFDVFVALGGIFFVWGQFGRGKSKKNREDDFDALTTIKIKDATIIELRSQLTLLQNTVIQDGKDIAVLRAENERLTKLVQNRNPELEQFMRQTTSSLLIIEKSLEALLKVQTTSNVTINK